MRRNPWLRLLGWSGALAAGVGLWALAWWTWTAFQ